MLDLQLNCETKYAAVHSATASAAPSFYKDVLPVFQAHCQSCHRAGEAAPMGSQRLRDGAAGPRRSKRQWSRGPCSVFADPHVGKFSNDARLSDQAFEHCGMGGRGCAGGDLKDAPKPVAWVNGWRIGEPELVIEMRGRWKSHLGDAWVSIRERADEF